MKFGSFVALALAAMPLSASAQTSAATAPAATTDADPALWVIKDADTTIYLFGTVHVLKPGLSWFDEAVKTAFDKSDELVLEINEPDPAAMQPLMMKLGFDAAGKPLSQALPGDKGAAYLKAMSGIGMQPAVAEHFKPWLAATVLSVAPLQKLGYAPANGPEHVLTAAAKTEGKKLGELETAEQQLGYLAGLSQSAQIAFLTSTLDDQSNLGAMMNEMVADWSKGKPEALAKLLNEDLTGQPELRKTLLTDRNARWATWVNERMKRPGTVFVAVGAGHLAGKGSVQDNLSKTYHLKAVRVVY
jgi:uncharacterized protein YbaP (TraB family)